MATPREIEITIKFHLVDENWWEFPQGPDSDPAQSRIQFEYSTDPTSISDTQKAYIEDRIVRSLAHTMKHPGLNPPERTGPGTGKLLAFT